MKEYLGTRVYTIVDAEETNYDVSKTTSNQKKDLKFHPRKMINLKMYKVVLVTSKQSNQLHISHC